MESEEVARSNFLKKVSVEFSESKLDPPFQNFLDPSLHCSWCQILVLSFSTQRRRHLRKIRILPQSISNNTGEELTTLRLLKSSKTDNNSHTAVSINS